MFSVIRAVFFVCLLVHLSSCLKINRCNKAIKRGRNQKIVLPADCTDGTLYWGYPEKSLEIEIPDSRGRFTLCLGFVNDPFVRKGTYTTASKSRKFNLPSEKGQTVCMKYKDGITVKLCGPNKRKTYIAYIPYTITKAKIKGNFKVAAEGLVVDDNKTD